MKCERSARAHKHITQIVSTVLFASRRNHYTFFFACPSIDIFYFNIYLRQKSRICGIYSLARSSYEACFFTTKNAKKLTAYR